MKAAGFQVSHVPIMVTGMADFKRKLAAHAGPYARPCFGAGFWPWQQFQLAPMSSGRAIR